MKKNLIICLLSVKTLPVCLYHAHIIPEADLCPKWHERRPAASLPYTNPPSLMVVYGFYC